MVTGIVDISQVNIIKFTKTTIGIASSRRSEKKEGTRKRIEKKRK